MIKLSKSIWKNAILIAGVFTFFFLVINIAFYSIINYQLNLELDHKLEHEMEHLSHSMKIVCDSITFISMHEFMESDLREVTESPFFLQIYDFDKNILFTSDNIKKFYPIELRIFSFTEPYYFGNIDVGEEELRIGYQLIKNKEDNPIAIMQLSTRKIQLDNTINNMIFYNSLIFPVFILIIFGISILISKRAYNPFNQIIRIAEKISTSNLSDRILFKAEPDDELGRLTYTLNNLFERLEKQVNELNSFTGNASHQLLTPLTVINSEIEYILKMQHDNAQITESLSNIKNQNERMINIIKSLLIMAKTGSIKEDLKNVFDLSFLLNEQIKKLFLQSDIKIECEDELYLRGQSEYFLVVVQNLVDNAIKYSNGQQVNINAYKKFDKIILSVQDTGVGVDEYDKDRIFEKFYRSSKSEALGIKGTGLGLSLVKSIVDSMSGEIEITKNGLQGTIFTITLPSLQFE